MKPVKRILSKYIVLIAVVFILAQTIVLGMVALDNGDKIRGDASSSGLVDYTLYGFIGTTATQLADGQLASSIGDLYTAGAAGIGVSSIVLVNTASTTKTVNLYITPSGGTERRLIPKDLVLGAGFSLHTDGTKVTVMNASGEVLTSATGGSGETNTASNQGSVGQGIFKQKTGVDFEHYKVTPTPPISFSLDGTDKIDLTFASSTDIDANTTHISSDGSDHSDVVLNTSHPTSTGMHATTTPMSAIGMIIGNGTDVISSGIAGDVRIPFSGIIREVTILSHTSSTITIDIWKDILGNYPPTDADSITATSTPVMTTGKSYNDLNLMGWVTSTVIGDVFTFNVDNATTTPQATIQLRIEKQW